MDRRKFLLTSSAGALGVSLSPNILASSGSKKQLPNELWQWDAIDMAEQIRKGTVSSVEVVQSCLDRIDAVNSEYNALTRIFAKEALAQAKLADKQLRQGEAVGVLHGVPITIKVNVDVENDATTNGVSNNKDKIATENSPVVSNLLKAGAVIVGRSNTPSFSFRWFTENPLHGKTLNPWNSDITPGGSSGGASVSVAAGMVPLAHGNDIAGSIRYPAYACGIAGLRPTTGRVPAYTGTSGGAGRYFGSQFMSVQGPLARNVADLRLGLAAMSGQDPRDPLWVNMPLEYNDSGTPVRVALVEEIPGSIINPYVKDALSKSAIWLEQAGYQVDRITPPHMEEALDIWLAIAMTDVRRGMVQAVDAFGDKPIQSAVHAMLDNAPTLDLDGYMKAIARRDELGREWSIFLQQYPLLLLPTSCALPYEWGADEQGKEVMNRILHDQAPLMGVAALSLPGLSVPTGLVKGDIPIGVQLVAGKFREDLCLAAGEVIQREAHMPTIYGA